MSAECQKRTLRVLARSSPPAFYRHAGPDGLDDSKRPSTLEKAIKRGEEACSCKGKDVPGGPVFKRVKHQHCSDGKQPK